MKLRSEGLKRAGGEASQRERSEYLAQLSKRSISERLRRRSGARHEIVEMQIVCRVVGEAAGAGSEAGVGDHLLDRLDAGDGLFGEGEAEGNCSEEFPVYIHRASAHALHDAGLSERAAAEPGDDDRLFGREVFEDSEDLDVEVFDLIPVEDSTADAVLPWADVMKGEQLLRTGWASESEAVKSSAEQGSGKPFKPRWIGRLTHISHCSADWLADLRCD